MKAVKVKENIYWVGVKDWNLIEFHGYDTPYGSTYNSYLIKDEKIALIDGVKHYLSAEQIERIEDIVDLSKIDYLVVNHVEQDHSGNIPELMKLAPQITIVTNSAGKMALEAHFDTEGWNFQIIKTGDSLKLGKRSLTFVTTPLLHWPDSMMSYCPEEKILFSNDGFGQHYCTNTIWAGEANFGMVCEEAKSYYANILFPYGMQAQKALSTANELNLDIEMIAPSHGCIWNGNKEVSWIVSHYAKWAAAENNGSAVVVYDTMWGATAKLADTITAVFQDAGVPVVKRCLGNKHISEVMTDILEAKYVAIGTPTLNNEIFPRVAAFILKGWHPKTKKDLPLGLMVGVRE